MRTPPRAKPGLELLSSEGDDKEADVLLMLIAIMVTHNSYQWQLSACSGHFAKPVIREILSLPFFDRLQNQAGHEFGLVAGGVIG